MELVTRTIRIMQGDHRPFLVRPIGDIQYTGDDTTAAMGQLQEDLDVVKAADDRGLFLGMGDYGDFASPSNRSRIDGAALYDTAKNVLDKAALGLTSDLYHRAFKGTEGRWLGLVHGHHYFKLQTGMLTDQKLCEWLDAPFLGTNAVVRLRFIFGAKSKAARETMMNVVLWVHHGCGGGARIGAPINKLELTSLNWGGIDVFVMGHTTKAPVAPMNRLYPRWHGRGTPDLVHKKIMLVNSGGYSKTYVEGSKQGNVPMGGYGEHAMYGASVIGSPIIKIVPRIKDTGDGPTRRREWAPKITIEI